MSARILIIEDDPDSLELMRYLLACHGYRTLTATRGDTGLELAVQERPDAVICDIQLPGKNGTEIARTLRANASFDTVPLIAVSALAMVGDRERIMTAGFTTYVSKPIDPTSFVMRLAQVLGASVFPLEHQYPQAAPSPSLDLPRRQSLLVVDDTPLNLELKRSIFEPFGYRVLTAESVSRALELAHSARPSVVISDIQLEESDGFDLLNRFKADPLLQHIPVVFITSTYYDTATREQALREGAARFLLRPIEPADLLQEIAACLEGGS